MTRRVQVTITGTICPDDDDLRRYDVTTIAEYATRRAADVRGLGSMAAIVAEFDVPEIEFVPDEPKRYTLSEDVDGFWYVWDALQKIRCEFGVERVSRFSTFAEARQKADAAEDCYRRSQDR